MIRLLVVDDSPLMRRLLGELFAAEGDFEVAFARNGVEALDVLQTVRPDVITLDVQMPEMDGLTCLDRIMLERPTPVVMASSVTEAGAAEALKAIELGAVDFIAKPAGAVSLRMDQFGPPLVEKVRAAAQASLPKARRLRDRVRARLPAAARAVEPEPRGEPPLADPARPRPAGEGLVAIGASTGGPPALDAVLEVLPANFPWPIVIAQHMPGAFTGPLARRLDTLTPLTVLEIVQPTRLRAGEVYIARGDADLIVSRRDGALVAMNAPSSSAHRWHPSVDRLVESALAVMAADRICGVLLTGMGDDGAASMARVRAGGGHTIAEAEETAIVYGMPRALAERGGAAEVAPLPDIGRRLVAAVRA